jgi:nucleotide-binding universal stress UspA family protein
MFKKILFATSASPACDNAAKVSFDLAQKNDAKLFTLHVLGVPSRGFSNTVTDLRTGEEETVDADYRDWVMEELSTTYANQLAEHENTTLELAVGVPATEILRFARKESVDLIVMGANTRDDDPESARSRSIVGRTMEKVARLAKCPVLIVKRPCTTCWKLFSNIVYCTDFSPAVDTAFEFAKTTAEEIGAKLNIFHAFDMSNAKMGLLPSQSDIERQLAAAQKKIDERYVSKLKDYDNYDVEIWEGTPYVEILKFAREKQADLIIMAHHTADVPAEDAELGSTIEQVVVRSACPVASVSRA